jgi:hypothetical protein
MVAGRAVTPLLIHIPTQVHFARRSVLDNIHFFRMLLGSAMLDSEFKRQRAQVLRDLVATTNDPFIKKRLLALMSRYEDRVSARTPLTSVDLKFQSQSAGSEQ